MRICAQSGKEEAFMIYQGIDFHNVAELEPTENGMLMWRLPAHVRKHCNTNLRTITAAYTTGTELRFKLRGDSIDIRLRSDSDTAARTAYLFYGSIQAGWQTSSYALTTQETVIHIERPANAQKLAELSKAHHLPFSSDVFRLVMPACTCWFLGAEGDAEPPAPEDLPAKTCLFYGSSITHGSIAMAMPQTYPFRIAQSLGCDYFNLGFAGTAHLEKEVAEYIVSRKDWDFATVEMGINMINAYTTEQFEERVKAFTALLKADGRPVFATSIFHSNGIDQEKAQIFREIVRRYSGEELHFLDGLDILSDPTHITQDLTHPSIEGVTDIITNWGAHIRKYL